MESLFISNRLVAALLVLLFCILTSCLHTKIPRKKSAGSNLGFEVSKRGLPANWIIYDPPHAEYRASLDTLNFKEGKRSLRFDIYRSAVEGRVNYAGFTNEFSSLTKGGGKYKLSYWVMNKGTKFRTYVNGVKTKGGGKNPAIIESAELISSWKLFETEIQIEPEMWLRFEIRIFKEGTFWIDDVRIEKLDKSN